MFPIKRLEHRWVYLVGMLRARKGSDAVANGHEQDGGTCI